MSADKSETTVAARVSMSIPAGMVIFTHLCAVTRVKMPGEDISPPRYYDTLHFSGADFPGGSGDLAALARSLIHAEAKAKESASHE